jgi:uncharacterized membrane protein
MSDLILLKFNDTYGAQQALGAVRALTELNKAWVDDVAVIERHKSGRVSTHTTHGSVSAGAWFGGLTGMLIGLLWPPAFFTLFLVGAGSGALMEKLVKETGLDKEMLKEIKDSLGKGESALLMLGASGDVDEMAAAFQKYNPTDVIRRTIDDASLEDLKTKLETATAEMETEEA